MKNLNNLKPTDSITVNQKKFLDSVFYKSIQDNPLADRLRRCPGCGIYHFVTHRSSDYHDDQCANDHYNLKRAQDAHAIKAGAQEPNEGLDDRSNELKNAADELTKEETITPEVADLKTINTIDQSKNQQFFANLIGDQSEIALTPDQLFSTGFNETGFDARVKFPGSDLNFCVYGEYCLSWLETDLIVINLLKDMLWAHT